MAKLGKVYFVGAGPGDPELLTVKGMRLLERAGAVLYAGSLVSEAALKWTQADCLNQDSKAMDLDEINSWLIEQASKHEIVVRLQTGDPSLYGALIEMVQALDKASIEVEVVPGVTSAMASAAAAVESLTLPEITQTVILTRVEGRTPMPQGEGLKDLAAHGCTLCIYLSITLMAKVKSELLEAGWKEDAPILVVQKASWPHEEKIIRGTLKDIGQKCKEAGVNSQAMIIASPTIGARQAEGLVQSKLYAKNFSHKFRKAKGIL